MMSLIFIARFNKSLMPKLREKIRYQLLTLGDFSKAKKEQAENGPSQRPLRLELVFELA